MARLALGAMLLAVAGADMQCTSEACPQDQVTDASALLQKVVGVQPHAAGSIQRTLSTYCKLLHALRGHHMFPGSEEAKQDTDEFQGLFADTVECSEDPLNPVIGYHLKDATLQQCFMKLSNHKKLQETMDKSACVQSIVDESKGTAVVVQEMGKTGGSGYMVRSANLLSFNEKGQITAHNAIYDSYSMLHAGAKIRPNADGFDPANGEPGGDIQHATDAYCKILHKLHHSHMFPGPGEAKQDTNEAQSLFADTIECSEDPLNPVIGYHLKDATLQQCLMKLSNHKKLQEPMDKSACIQSIVDESKGTAAVVQEFGKTSGNGYMVRGVNLLTFNEKGQITAYNAIWDSYNILHFKK